MVTGKVRLQWICEGQPTSTEDPITEDRMTLLELLRKSGDGDFCEPWRNRCCRSGWKPMSKALIGVGRHERTGDRLNYRSGYGARSLDARLGSLQLRIPKLRQGHLGNALAHVPKPARHGRRCDAATFLQADAKAASRLGERRRSAARTLAQARQLIDDSEHMFSLT